MLLFSDVRTQASYQGMDPDFIGLIFSVFQHDDNEKVSMIFIIVKHMQLCLYCALVRQRVHDLLSI